MSSDLSREALEATFSELDYLVILPERLVMEGEEADLGAGGYGEVCLATLDKSSESQRKVAVKQLRMVEASVASRRIAYRLARELKVWAKVKHPNILELIGYYLSENYVRAQFVSAFMVNGNVMQYIRRVHVGVAIRLKFVRDIAAGLTYLHDLRPPICHGDLKPANVLVNDNLDAVLCDFGVSSFVRESYAASGLTTSKSPKGSFRYMSPELILQNESKHTLESDVWALGCTAFEIFTEKAPYSTSTKDCAIILEVLKNSAPGSIDALSIVILGTDVDPACHNALSSLRSIILQCWDFDPAKRPRSSRISEKIAIPSEMKAHSAAWEDQEGGTSSLRIRDDSRHGGSASQKDVPPCRAHPLCMNCQQNPKLGEQDFCSKACRDEASSRLRASAQKNASIQRPNRPNFAKLVSRFTAKRPEISIPYNPVHLTHVSVDPATGESTGLPREWEPILQENGIARQYKEKDAQAVASAVKFHQRTASAPGTTAENVIATSPTMSGSYELVEGLRINTQVKLAGAGQTTPSGGNPKEDRDAGTRTGSFNTLAQRAPQDPQPVAHHHQSNSIMKTVYDIGRFRPSRTAGGASSGFQPPRSTMSVPTITTSTALESAQVHRGAQQSSDPLRRPVAVKHLRSTDMDPSDERRMRKRRGGENVGAELDGTAPGRPKSPFVDLPRSSTPRTGLRTDAAGSNSFETPGQAPFPPLPSAIQIQPRLELDEGRDDLSSACEKRSRTLNALDCTGQLNERTEPKFTGDFSDVSQAKLGDRVVAVKAVRVANIENGEDRIWKRLEREIYEWAALVHPNVLELLGFAFEDGTPCLISPWCENGTLQDYLQKFPDANRRRLVREIAEGLKYLHVQTPPLIHGDLKTTTVLVTGDYVAKISDFRSSRRVEQLRTSFTTAGLVLTTIRYRAPEILRDGQDPTLCSDVFSFACVALATMTDKSPFWRIPKPVEVISQILIKRQKPSPEDHPGMEEAIWELLRRCWDYQPLDRPAMIDVCQTLARAGYGDPPPRLGPSSRGGLTV